MAKKKKAQKDKQRSIRHTYKAKDRIPRTPLKTGVELMCSGRVSSSCSTIDTPRVNLVTNPVISHERGKDWEVFATSRTYIWPDVIKHSSIKCRTLTPKLFNQNLVLNGYDFLIECFSQIRTKFVLLSFMTVNRAVYNVRTIRNTINFVMYVV